MQAGRKSLNCREMKTTPVRAEIADAGRRLATSSRMCVLACFNLIEAYINGLAWEYVQTHNVATLSKNDQKMLQEADGSIIRRLINVPNLISGTNGPLSDVQSPLKDFLEIIKPYRDSIVHASPFSAPAKFGGYEKLQKLYELNTNTVITAVEVTIEIISIIHNHTGGENELPSWFIPRRGDGTFMREEGK